MITIEQIENDIRLKYPTMNIIYSPNESMILNGQLVLRYDDVEILADVYPTEQVVYWNEKNQSDKIRLKKQISVMESQLKEASANALVLK